MNFHTHALLRSVGDLFFPRLCPVCDNRLMEGETDLCLPCLQHLPKTGYHRWPGNPMEQLFWGRETVERAVALFHFLPGSPYRRLIHAIKYQRAWQTAEALARRYALELKAGGLFSSVTAVVPVPLHARRLRNRGYNQSEAIARGVAAALELPLHTDWLTRESDNESQTGKSRDERWRDTRRLFRAGAGRIPAQSHLLLVDDVVTTGSTLLACCEAIRRETPDCRISVLVLAAADS